MTAGQLVALLDLTLLGHVDAHELVDAGRQLVAVLAGEAEDADDAAAGAVRHLEGGVANLAGLLAEDGAQQALLGGKLGLTLRGDLAHQDIAREHFRAHADDAVGVEVGDHVIGDVGDLAGDFLGAELGVARVDFVLGDVNGRQQVLGDHALGHDDGVLVVEAFPRHVGDHEVLAKRKLAQVARRAVSQHVARGHFVALAHDGLVVDAARLVGTLELRDEVLVVFAVVVQDDDGLAINVVNHAGVLRDQDLAGVNGNAMLDAGTDQRSGRTQQRHSLTLHGLRRRARGTE